jgi:hypothetical protein
MRYGRGVLVLIARVCALCPWAGTAGAQTPAGRLAVARTQVRNGEYDSATAMLNPVFQDARTTAAQRSRAFLLSAAALFMKENMALSSQARAMLQLSLRADSSVRVDDDLNTDVPGIRDQFEALRRELYPLVAGPRAPGLAPLMVQPMMLGDTVLPVTGGRFPVAPRPSRWARAYVALTKADAPGVVIWSDTLAAGSAGPLAWDLHDRDGAIVEPGRYALQVWAVDQAGERSPTVERTLEVSRVAVDTQPLPPPLEPSSFEPETLRLKRASPTTLVVAAGLGAAAALLPEALARTELTEGRQRDGTQYLVAGAVTLAGVVGFLAGHRVQPVPEAARRNAELRQRDAADRQEIARSNAEMRANAPVRVRLETSEP